MPHVPDQPVLGRVEDIMDRGRQFDHTKPRSQMPAGDRNCADCLGAQLIGKLAELFGLQLSEIGRIIDDIEQRCFGSV